jgi:hypothetical protein
MSNNTLMTTAEAAELVRRKAVELNGIVLQSQNSKCVTHFGRSVFRVCCVAREGQKKFWSVEVK